MSKTKRILAFVLAAVLAVVVLSGCKSIAQKVFGSSNEVQEDDTTQWAVLSSDPLVIDGIADTTAKYATARANGALNIVFNGIWSRQTEYFTVPSGLLSIYGCGTTDGGAQKFKVSLWKKVDGGAQYVDKFYRIQRGFGWWADEQPSEQTKQKVEAVIADCEDIDIILSHTCPKKYIPTEMFLPMVDQSAVDSSTEEWLDRIEDTVNYKVWYCGHWHTDKRIDKMHFLYKTFECLDD